MVLFDSRKIFFINKGITDIPIEMRNEEERHGTKISDTKPKQNPGPKPLDATRNRNGTDTLLCLQACRDPLSCSCPIGTKNKYRWF